MESEVKVYPDFVHVVATGALTTEDAIERIRRQFGDSGVPADLPRLIDLRGVTTVPGLAMARGLGHLASRSVPVPARRALVLPRGAEWEMVPKVYAAAAGDSIGEMQLFQNVKDAPAWLGVSLPPEIQ